MLTCKCGSKSFHTFFKYRSMKMERVRCNNCGRTYEVSGGKREEINLAKEWDKQIIEITI